MDQSYILELVNIVTASHPELTPHEKKIVSRVKGNKLYSKNTSTTGKKKLLIDDLGNDINEESPSLIDEDDSECIPLKYVENRIISKKGDIELEKGNLDEAEEIFRQGLKKFTKLKKTIKSKKYDIDKVVLLFNLGRVSLSKSIQVNPDIIHILWEKPYSIIHRLDKERDAVIEEYSKMMGADEGILRNEI
jgi:hypothetical protein